MIQSLFQFLRPHINESNKIENLKSLLKETLAWQSFEDIFNEFGETDGQKISTFIIYTFCSDSTFFLASDSYDDTKNGIAELCGLNTEEYYDVIHLKNVSVIKAVNFVASEIKSWKFKKMLRYREAASMLGELSTKHPNPKEKNSAKNLRDAAVFEQELNEKADFLENQVFSQSKSKERIKETLSVSIDHMSMESILKGIK